MIRRPPSSTRTTPSFPARRSSDLPATGTLRFGDGQNGRIPGAGRALFARSYRHGGGTAGNVAAGEIKSRISTLSGIAGVSNRRAAVGGADAETSESLARAAPGRLSSGGRLITAARSEGQTSELPPLMRTSYGVLGLTK